MIKNIIFDIDGVLTNLDRCYFNFLKKSYKEFENMRYEEMTTLFPIEVHDGSFELPKKFSHDFYVSPYYCDRPLFDDTLNILHSLKKKGLKLFTLSAAGDQAKKRKWLEGLFVDIFDSLEFSPAGVAKDLALIEVLEKHNLNKAETVFIDDRFYNVKAGLNVGLTTVRMQPDFHLPLPRELEHVKVVKSLREFEEYIDGMRK